jgi:hypothetical protein
VLRWDCLELCRRFLIQRPRTLEVSALCVQNRDRRLYQSLIEKFQLAVGALPDFFPGFVALEETPLVEEVDPLFVKIRMIFQPAWLNRVVMLKARRLVLSLLTDL